METESRLLVPRGAGGKGLRRDSSRGRGLVWGRAKNVLEVDRRAGRVTFLTYETQPDGSLGKVHLMLHEFYAHFLKMKGNNV